MILANLHCSTQPQKLNQSGNRESKDTERGNKATQPLHPHRLATASILCLLDS